MDKTYFFVYKDGLFKVYDNEYYIRNKDSILCLYHDGNGNQEPLEKFSIDFARRGILNNIILYLLEFDIESVIDRSDYDIKHLSSRLKSYILDENINSIIDEYKDILDFIKQFIFEGKPFSDEAFYEGTKKLKDKCSSLNGLKDVMLDLIETYDYKAYCERFFQNIPMNIIKITEDVRNGTIIS